MSTRIRNIISKSFFSTQQINPGKYDFYEKEDPSDNKRLKLLEESGIKGYKCKWYANNLISHGLEAHMIYIYPQNLDLVYPENATFL